MSMLDRAVNIMTVNRNKVVWTLSELRAATAIALKSQYRLSEQLKADARVEHLGANRFALAA